MLKILTKIFIKDNDISHPKVRTKYGLMSGIVGIFVNISLSIIKIIAGVLVGSIAIIADGVNNVSDGASSAITVIAFKLSDAPADKEHPFGHKRLEYVSGVIVAVMILFVGFILAQSSIDKIINPTTLDFNNYYLIIIILILSILMKLWLWSFYRKVGKLINSETLKVSSSDSLNDVITTFVVLISLIIGRETGLKLDGYFGLAVAIYIIINGISLIKETISPLLGEAPRKEIVEKIADKLLNYNGVLGFHDLVIHSYGPDKRFVTVHVEVDSKICVTITHDIIDKIEQDFLKENINMVIHMDPVDINDPYTLDLKDKVAKIINDVNPQLSFHDFRIVRGKTHTKVLFDLVIPCGYKVPDYEIEEELKTRIKEIDNTFTVVIIFDHNYIG